MNVAVVGATGVVGTTLLRVLEERGLPVRRLGAFAARARTGEATFCGQPIDVGVPERESLASYDVVFFAGSEDASERFAPELARDGRVVIDNSPAFRMADGVRLIVPEINGADVTATDRIFPVANCTAILLTMALAPIERVAGLKSIAVATYQAVSGAGRETLELFDRGEGPIVGNVVPQIGAVGAGGATGEELKVAEETRKILGSSDLRIDVTCVRVPVRTAHSEAVFFETQQDVSVARLAAALAAAPGLTFHERGIVTPREVEGSDEVHVARLRSLDDSQRRFALWLTGDQLRKGAATNGVQILEMLLERGYVTA